ncbi:transcription factor EMB1444-like isoform X1 [Nicotiana tomentosiformis]|uniref:transcription factor EMB1444-like isoform X1 n=1 Tax=Nicotiana tomentosiformis TaxID=4098 RepID=UPI00087919F3|nr:transcription factor EMB1444-like isoform X1 [Nicotiana tomentosiformis]
MASQLQQALRSLCCNTPWKYAVFWKLTHRARMMLTWADAYYDNDGFPEKKSPGSAAGNLHDGYYSNNRLGVAVAKMSYHVYSLGEGIVGQVAITGKHLWLSADKGATITSLAPEHCDGWQAQFSVGIKTIVVAAVAPHGVVQLGSLDSKISEDLRVVKHIRDVFSELQESMASCLQSSMQNSMENSCLSEISTRTSGSEVFQVCVNNLGRNVCEDGKNMCSPLYTSVEKSFDHSCIFLQPGSYPNKILEVVNKQGLHETAVQGSGHCENLLPPSCESSLIKHQEEGQMWEETNPKFEGQSSNSRVLGKGSVDETEPTFRNNGSNESVSYDAGQVTELTVPYKNDLSSEAYNDRNGVLGVPDLPNAYPDKCAEKNLGFETECNYTMHTPFRFFAGYELFEALGPVFQKGNSSNDWEAGNQEEMAVEMLEEIGTSSLLKSSTGHEHLLEAVIANVNRHDNDSSSVKSFCKSVDSLLTTEITAEPCNSDIGTISSTGYSFDRETLNSFNSSGMCSIQSSRGFSSTSCSRGSGHVERPLEPTKMHKKRARPGESCRPRPRDRQLIQDRIKELRELVPNGSKCSIDSLLERTIKHMVFMQSITKHADKLKKCSASKLVDKELGISGSSFLEHGSSWAMEVGSNLKVCPMRVENLSMNGQILVEIFEDGSHFLDIAEAIRSLNLTILKGVAEACGERTRICFVVEGQNDRTLHRMDVLWSLMQKLQAKINM